MFIDCVSWGGGTQAKANDRPRLVHTNTGDEIDPSRSLKPEEDGAGLEERLRRVKNGSLDSTRTA